MRNDVVRHIETISRKDSDLDVKLKELNDIKHDLESCELSEEIISEIFLLILKRKPESPRVVKNLYEYAVELFSSEEYRNLQNGLRMVDGMRVVSDGIRVSRNNSIYLYRVHKSCSLRPGNALIHVNKKEIKIFISESAGEEFLDLTFRPFIPILDRLLECYLGGISGDFVFGFDDINYRDIGVYYCSNKRNDTLVPDYIFLRSGGYADLKKIKPTKWEERQNICYWRGSDYGVQYMIDVLLNQRITLSLLSKNCPDIIDAKIVAARSYGCSLEMTGFYHGLDVIGEPRPQEDMFNYKYLAVVDGISNSWGGMFSAMICGSAPLVADSPEGFMQWYYNELVPWVNYVPIKGDLSDLVEKVNFLKENDIFAKEIGEAARELAMRWSYDRGVDYAAHIIYRHIKEKS